MQSLEPSKIASCLEINPSTIVSHALNNCYNCCSIFQKNEHVVETFEAPLPWIGLYIAAATLFCGLAMAADIFLGFRHKKLWFPCKYFTLNAASLTLIAVAMKLAMDLTNPDVRQEDPISVLRARSTLVLYMAMSNLMPSLGPMNTKETISNLTALAILVITILVNLSIQLFSGVKAYGNDFIIEYLPYQIIDMFYFLTFFFTLCFSALTNLATAKYVRLKFANLQNRALNEELDRTGIICTERLKRDLKKYRIMVETGSPQFVMARSLLCSSTAAICFLNTFFILVDVTYFDRPNFTTDSKYKWSAIFIFVTQVIVVGVGGIPSAFRCINTVKFLCTREKRDKFKAKSKTEEYCTDMLIEWKETAIALNIKNQSCRKIVNFIKNLFLNVCIMVYKFNVVVCKNQLLISVHLMLPFFTCIHYYRWLKTKLIASRSYSVQSNGEMNFSSYVVLLEGENELSKGTLKNICDATDGLIRSGIKKQPKQLLELLKISNNGFMGVTKFDSETIKSLVTNEPSNSWMLSVVTLTSVAMAIPNIDKAEVKWILGSVDEGLRYAELVENTFNGKDDATNIKDAARLWLRIELYSKWFDHDLRKMASEEPNCKTILQRLSDLAKNYVVEFTTEAEDSQKENTLSWPVKVIAANSMYRVTQTLLLEYELGNENTDGKMFEKVCTLIADILAACFTNLPRVITAKCDCSRIKKREESAQQAACLLGEVEEILKFLEQRMLPCLDEDKATRIDEWRGILDEEYQLASASSIP